MAKFLVPLRDWIAGFLVEHWPAILVGSAGLIMTWLASLSDALRPYGAVAWGGVGILTVLVLAVAYWAAATGQRWRALTRFERQRSETADINPLDSHFAKRRLRLADFYHPFFQHTKAAQFRDCELLGPASVFLMGATLIECLFSQCEVVIVKDGASVVGAMAFENCSFVNSKFFRVTFLMTRAQYLSVIPEFRAGVPVISDGIAGPTQVRSGSGPSGPASPPPTKPGPSAPPP